MRDPSGESKRVGENGEEVTSWVWMLRIGLLLSLWVNLAHGQAGWRGLYDVERLDDPHPQQVAQA